MVRSAYPTNAVTLMSQAPQFPVDPRIYLAAERTFLAWIRTGLACMGFGFVVARFGLFMRELVLSNPTVAHHSSTGVSLPVGIALIGIGILVTIAAAVRHHRYIQAIERACFQQEFGVGFGVVVAVLLALFGLIMTLYLLVL